LQILLDFQTQTNQHEDAQHKLTVSEANDHASERERPTLLWKAALSSFIICFCLSVSTWLLPDSTPRKFELTTFIYSPMIAFGWMQYWGVFAPNPRNLLYHTTATITFEDGSTKLYEFPRTQMMSQWEKFCREKQRKLFGDNIPWKEGELFRPAVARYLALSNANPANQPTLVTMEMHQAWVTDPDPKNWTYRDRLPPHTESVSPFFVYRVAKKDLVTDPTLRQSY